MCSARIVVGRRRARLHGQNLAGTALVSGIAGLPLWLLSYAWLPFALMGREVEFVRYAVVGGEVGALAAGALGVGLALRPGEVPAPGQRSIGRHQAAW